MVELQFLLAMSVSDYMEETMNYFIFLSCSCLVMNVYVSIPIRFIFKYTQAQRCSKTLSTILRMYSSALLDLKEIISY